MSDLADIPAMLRNLADKIESFELSYRAVVVVGVPHNKMDVVVYGFGPDDELEPVGKAEEILDRGIDRLKNLQNLADDE